MIRGLNHLTLAVTVLDRSMAFYVGGLGARLANRWAGGADLTLGNVWLCLSVDPPTSAGRDYTHAAFDVAAEAFHPAARRGPAAGAVEGKENRPEGASYHFLDPDGRLELYVGTLETRLAAMECCA